MLAGCRDNAGGTVSVSVQSNVAGLVGLRLAVRPSPPCPDPSSPARGWPAPLNQPCRLLRCGEVNRAVCGAGRIDRLCARSADGPCLRRGAQPAADCGGGRGRAAAPKPQPRAHLHRCGSINDCLSKTARCFLVPLESHARCGAAEVPAGSSTVTASFRRDCSADLAAAVATSGGEGVVAAAGLPTIPPFPTPSYPGSWKVDSTTGGDWIGKYGTAGYSLFGFDSGKDLTKLPSWVQHVYPGAKGSNEAGVKSKFVGADSRNKAYLADPRAGAAGNRALAWASHSGNYYGADGSQGGGRPHSLAIFLECLVEPRG